MTYEKMCIEARVKYDELFREDDLTGDLIEKLRELIDDRDEEECHWWELYYDNGAGFIVSISTEDEDENSKISFIGDVPQEPLLSAVMHLKHQVEWRDGKWK